MIAKPIALLAHISIKEHMNFVLYLLHISVHMQAMRFKYKLKQNLRNVKISRDVPT